ncbi:MAG TPA: phytanoyl-CoA dioxygenase family protein [Chthonomonadaceae bacterium]|nr:phytanoyl-CoA dioxygenase family protein [Chthonomonadaceae bacterium]
MALTEQQRQHFEEQGYVVVPGVVDEASLEPVRRAIAKAVEREAQKLYAEGRITSLYTEAPFTRRLAAMHRETGEELGIWNNEVFSRAVYDLLVYPPLLDVVESLIGPEITVNGDYWVRPKLPGGKLITYPWHQDSAYYGPASIPIPILTVWVPLIDVDEHNGCLKVIPGSHQWGQRPMRSEEPFLVPVEDVETMGQPPITLPMRVGDVVILSRFTFHGSLRNHSEDVRWSIDLRYSPTGYDMAWLFDRFPGFVARSRRNPASVDSWEAWRAYRRQSRQATDAPVDR